MAQDWEIKSRSRECSATGRAFADKEPFFTLLFQEKDGYRREDLCEEAFADRNADIAPFSFWKSTFEEPAAAPPEALPHQSAEDLLRRFMEEDHPEHLHVRYVLAVMLERKKLLKHVDTKETEGGPPLLIYEHAGTGEIFLIPDPELHLDQVSAVQGEIAVLLGAKPPGQRETGNTDTASPESAG